MSSTHVWNLRDFVFHVVRNIFVEIPKFWHDWLYPLCNFFYVAVYCLLVAPVSKNNHFMKIAFYSLPFILDTSSPMDEESRKTNNIQV